MKFSVHLFLADTRDASAQDIFQAHGGPRGDCTGLIPD